MRSDRILFRCRMAQCLRNTACRWVTALLSVCLLSPAYATSSPPRPVISAWVTSPHLTTALNIKPDHVGKYPYGFHASIVWPERDIVYAKVK